MPNVQGGIVEYFQPGADLPLTASATITGGQLVELTGNRTVGPAGAASTKCIGVAKHNAASGEIVSVAREGVWPVTAAAAGACATGDTLICAAAGTFTPAGATPDARTVIGRALEAIANGATGRVALMLG